MWFPPAINLWEAPWYHGPQCISCVLVEAHASPLQGLPRILAWLSPNPLGLPRSQLTSHTLPRIHVGEYHCSSLNSTISYRDAEEGFEYPKCRHYWWHAHKCQVRTHHSCPSMVSPSCVRLDLFLNSVTRSVFVLGWWGKKNWEQFTVRSSPSLILVEPHNAPLQFHTWDT